MNGNAQKWLNSYMSGFEKKAIQKVGLYYTHLTIIDKKFLYIFSHNDQPYVTNYVKQYYNAISNTKSIIGKHSDIWVIDNIIAWYVFIL